MAESTSPVAAATVIEPPEPWSPWAHERTRAGLTSPDRVVRSAALVNTVQPDAPVDEWISELVFCVDHSREDATALQLAATALVAIKTDAARPAAVDCLATLATTDNASAVRTMAAQGFWAHKQIPLAAWRSVSEMVFSDDPILRQIAFSAALPHAIVGAPAIAAKSAEVGPVGWTAEGLGLLAASAGNSEPKQRQVETYVMRALQGEATISTFVAGYAALARLNPNGVGALALAKLAGAAQTLPDAALALGALRQLAELGRPAVAALVEQLVNTDDPEREDELCRTLLELKITDREVPLPRTLQRIESGPEKAVVAHCIFLSLHRKAFSRAAPVVAKRFARASDALKLVLGPVYEMLTGQQLASVASAAQP